MSSVALAEVEFYGGPWDGRVEKVLETATVVTVNVKSNSGVIMSRHVYSRSKASTRYLFHLGRVEDDDT